MQDCSSGIGQLDAEERPVRVETRVRRPLIPFNRCHCDLLKIKLCAAMVMWGGR